MTNENPKSQQAEAGGEQGTTENQAQGPSVSGPSASRPSATGPYGTWASPITAGLVAEGAIGLSGPAVRNPGGSAAETWWAELRPNEAGRVVLVCDGEDQIKAPFSARTRVHEYGGRAWWLGYEGRTYFANWDDQRLYRIDGSGQQPVAITPEPTERHAYRYTDGVETPDGKWVICVREDHHAEVIASRGEAANEIVAIPVRGKTAPQVLASEADMVAAPRVSPDGRWLSWFQWDHPRMPWDGTELCAAALYASGRIGQPQVVAGGPDQALHGPDWTSAGDLVFSSDETGWWNLYKWAPGASKPVPMTQLVGSEIGGPPWVFGTQHWAELPSGDLAVIWTIDAAERLAVLGADNYPVVLDVPTAQVSGITAGPNGGVCAVASTPRSLPAVIEVDPETGGLMFHRPANDLGVDQRWFSLGEKIGFASADGRPGHAYFYAPTGPDSGDERRSELPPLVVMGHGGPTSHSTPALSLKVQYWTSRGFAVVDVNYGGSTGYGREYRRLLDGKWGIVDVEDVVSAATALVRGRRVDANRITIRGGSAGGFTVLAALEQSDIFSAGTSLYGVADLTALAEDTHKFESRYLDGLVGPWPEARAVYEERSPLHHADKLNSPLLVMQGSEDEVVPPNQSQAIVAAVAQKGLPHAYLEFEGEQHGFRKGENIIRSLEAELWFYGRVFGFTPHDQIAPVEGAVGL